MSIVPQIRGVHPSLAFVLNDLAVQIREQQDLARQASYSALECWMTIGKLLTEAKMKCSHGSWLSWLSQSTTLSTRQSQRYMQVWSNRKIIRERIESGGSFDNFDNLKVTLRSICPPEKTKDKYVPGDAFEHGESEQTIDVTEDANDLEALKQRGIEVEIEGVEIEGVEIEEIEVEIQDEQVVETPDRHERFEALFSEKPDQKSEELIEVPQSDLATPFEKWLQSLPLSGKLKGRPLRLFRADALFWRSTEESRQKMLSFFNEQKSNVSEELGVKKCEGRFASDCTSALSVWHPKFWGCCPVCKGSGEDEAGLCRRCGGYGYVTV